MKITSTPSRKRGAASETQENDNCKKACLQWLTYFNEMIVCIKRIESQDVFNLVKPQRPGIAFPDLVKKAPKQNLQLTGIDLHVYLMDHLVNNNERVDSLQILKGDATLDEAKVFLLRKLRPAGFARHCTVYHNKIVFPHGFISITLSTDIHHNRGLY